MNTIKTGYKDVVWGYIATFLLIGSGVVLLPFILNSFPKELVAIWNIFSTIIALTTLLDFGFNTSFARNVSYVVSGVKVLKKNGFHTSTENTEIDFSLFKGLINAMRWFYKRIASVLFLFLAALGTFYIFTVLKKYSGNHTEVYISWIILCIINSYSLYTFYYDALLQGKGLIKKAKQIQVIGQICYLAIAIVLISLNFNLVAIVSAQAFSIIIRRILSYRTIYTPQFKEQLHGVIAQPVKDILKPIYHNALKLGIVNSSNFLVLRSPILIGALFLSLDDIASYGITVQFINIIGSVSTVYISTYLPKIAQLRIHDNIIGVKKIFYNSALFMFLTFLLGGLCLIIGGDWALNLIKSNTHLLSKSFIFIALIASWSDYNRGMAECVLSTKNEIPFFKVSLFTGVLSVILLLLLLIFTNLGVWSLVLAPFIAQICYHNWKWPLEALKEFKTVKNK